MSKIIEISCTASEIQRAITEIKEYQTQFLRKVDTFRKRVAKETLEIAQSGFNGAVVDDILPGYEGRVRAEVKVEHRDDGTVSVVYTNSEDAIWVEFGAGVYYNGSVGGSPHPMGVSLGYTIGGYGKGRGKGDTWGYYTDPGEKTGLVLTHGTPAKMPMYNALKEISARVVSIAKEVFGQ